jgi:hypothetical protein
MAIQLLGSNGTKGILQRTGIIATIGTTVISLAQQLVPLWIQDPRLQETIILLITALTSAVLAAIGNPSKTSVSK